MISVSTIIIPDLEILKIGSLDSRGGSPGNVPYSPFQDDAFQLDAFQNAPDLPDLRIGATNNVELGAKWTQAEPGWVKKVRLVLRRNGSITAGKIVKVRIETDLAGSPSGTSLGSSANVLCTSIGTDYRWITFTFATHIYLAAGTYHLVLSGDYTPSLTNNVSWRSRTVASGGNQEIKDTTWTPVATQMAEVFAEEWDCDVLGFCEPVVYTSPTGTLSEFAGNFEEPFSLSDIAGVGYENARPVLTCRSEDVDDATQSARVSVEGVNYYVIGIQPDGDGLTDLVLSEDAPA